MGSVLSIVVVFLSVLKTSAVIMFLTVKLDLILK